MRITLTIVLVCGMSFAMSAQQKAVTKNIAPKDLGALPKSVPEASGLKMDSQKKLWTHNDGGVPALYSIDLTGKLTRTVHINTRNAGWEELAVDKAGNFYVGAIGNNDNKKEDFKIYKISDPATLSDAVVTPEVIHFSYSDQGNKSKRYDADAMTIMNDSLYIFSKRPSPKGFIRVYKLPTVAGTHTAVLIDSIHVGGTSLEYWITGADITPDGKYLILLSHEKMIALSNYQRDHFSTAQKKTIGLTTFTHKAGICFYENRKAYIVDEVEAFVGGGMLYSIDLTSSLP